MVINELFSTENKKDKEFFKVPYNVQQYFDLKKRDENLGNTMVDNIIKHLSNHKPQR